MQRQRKVIKKYKKRNKVKFYKSHFFVDFNIDRQGNAVDITVKGKGGEVISPILQSEIIRLFQDDFKWSSSQLRSFKIRRIIPITLFSN